ncbi:hypothetical protein CTT31_07745 [Pseudoalteromonas maricaloris]|uniref:hypothetical protein n=1 Tax=Pseudoalteromonas maricaloris TaxID=184924 RepID=UPI0021AE2A11|nr:hypothetical protein [Pseudoalteromonas flavipulchra]USE69011.1 hypothetical protein CTT31_07745 [Pseudoalteromonas flavipulchra]
MYTQVEKSKENKNRLAVNSVAQNKIHIKHGVADNRRNAVEQKKVQESENYSSQELLLANGAIQKANLSQPIQRMGLLPVLGAISTAALLYMLRYDSKVRQQNYTSKVKNIPVVASEIFDDAEQAKQKGEEVDPNLHQIVTEGAIEVRNRQMEDTREKITPLGRMLSVFMKKEGLTMNQLMEKYKSRFPEKNEEEIFKLIIDSAGRSNPSLASKFLASLMKPRL